MRVLRGRGGTIADDRVITRRVREAVARTGEPALRVWRPPRQVAFGRRDANEAGYDLARRRARECGYPPVERSVGGRAVAFEGSTVAFAFATPIDGIRGDTERRYRTATETLREALVDVGVDPEHGEPDAAFCPGSHSLSANGRKIAGIAQRVTSDSALVAGVVVPRDREALAEALTPVYDALEVPFDPATVGSVAAAGGDGDPDAVRFAIESALVGDREASVERVEDFDG